MLKNVLQICLLCAFNGILTSGQGLANKVPAKWSTNILQEGVSVSALQSIEPGFDLSDEEINKLKLWPHGIVYYYIDNFSYDKVLRDRIRNYLDLFSGLTGVHFFELQNPPLDDKERWVLFVNRRGLLGCADHDVQNFTTIGIQRVVLGYDCICNGAEIAEVALAIVGVPSQHNSPDRDLYIEVDYSRIIPEKIYLFNKLDNKEWLFHDLEYDFASATHFNFHKHSIDGTSTIKPIKPVEVRVGEGDGLSYTDVLKVRMLYNYISKKKYNSAKAPECNKLFKPGSNFNKYRPKEDDDEPRTKPYKYLGLPDDDKDDYGKLKKIYNSTENEDELDASGNENDIDISKDINEDETEENGKDEEFVSEFKPYDIKTLKGSLHGLKKPNAKMTKSPLIELSDYETGDERVERLKGRFQALKGPQHGHKTATAKKTKSPLMELSDYQTGDERETLKGRYRPPAPYKQRTVR